MVPQVDVKDTEVLLTSVRETAEAVRKEILGWVLPKEQTSNDAEAQALRKLAARSAQQTRQWTGRMLGELGTAYPYPNSSDGSTQIIDKTAVPEKNGLELPADATVVQKIKHTRGVLSGLKGQLEVLVTQCIPGTCFNQYLFKVQEHALQTSMWLGELLHEFYEAQPKPEATAGREFTPEEAAADLAKIQADSEPGDQFKANLEAVVASLKGHETTQAGPATGQFIPEAVAPKNESGPTPTMSELSESGPSEPTKSSPAEFSSTETSTEASSTPTGNSEAEASGKLSVSSSTENESVSALTTGEDSTSGTETPSEKQADISAGTDTPEGAELMQAVTTASKKDKKSVRK